MGTSFCCLQNPRKAEKAKPAWKRIEDYMSDGHWDTLHGISAHMRHTGRNVSEAAVSARLRDLSNGTTANWLKEKRTVPGGGGLVEYRILNHGQAELFA